MNHKTHLFLGSLQSRLPRQLGSVTRSIYRFVFARTHQRKINRLKRAHISFQPPAQDLFALRKDMVFSIHPSSREAYESFCYISPELVTEMDCFLESTQGLQSFFDVGSFHGAFSMGFASQNKGAKVIALEPSPDPFTTLSKNCSLNAQYDILPLMSAAGSENGIIKMAKEWQHFIAADESMADSSAEVFDVPVSRLDDLAIQHHCWPDAIKIDVEGFEAEVLAGASECLKRCKVLHLELHPEPLAKRGIDPLDLLKQLAKKGFAARTPEGKKLDLCKCTLPSSVFRIALIQSAFQP